MLYVSSFLHLPSSLPSFLHIYIYIYNIRTHLDHRHIILHVHLDLDATDGRKEEDEGIKEGGKMALNEGR